MSYRHSEQYSGPPSYHPAAESTYGSQSRSAAVQEGGSRSPYPPLSDRDRASPPSVPAGTGRFLDSDPYARDGEGGLSRSDTLGPLDSASSYNVRMRGSSGDDGGDDGGHDGGDGDEYAPSQVGGAQERGLGAYTPHGYEGGDAYVYGHGPDGSRSDRYSQSQGQSQGHFYGASGADLPLKDHAGEMGYADDAYEMSDAKRESRGDGGGDGDGVEPAPLFSNYLPPALEGGKFSDDEEARSGLLGRFKKGSLEEEIEKRKKGIYRQRWPILSWLLAASFVVVFVVELVKAKSLTGSAIQIHPSVNPMIGPSFEFLINFGARFTPCMRKVPTIPTTENFPCLNVSTANVQSYTASQLCPISEICGLKDASNPNQSYRFVAPMFIHAGFIHIAFNLLVQLQLCTLIERQLSTPFFAIVYFAGGIGGFLLGGNFGLVGQPAVGASGAIYTCISIELVDLCYNWKYEYRARMRLTVSIVFTIIGLGIGLLPGLDNFSHIGGFAVGILGGLLFCPSIHVTRRHKLVVWGLRAVSLALLVAFFAGLVTNFYNSQDPAQACRWCRYLSCLPVFSQCKNDGLTTSGRA